MASLTTILRLSQALVVALLVALAGGQAAPRDAACVAVQASQIAVAQAALSSAPPLTLPRTWRVNRPPPLRDHAVSELEEDSDSELEGGDEGSPTYSRPSVRIELQSRSKDDAGSRRTAPISVVVSEWMPTGHPRGPPV